MVLEHHKKGRQKKSLEHAAPSGASPLLAKLAARALARFPDNAFFQLLAGELELRKGPGKCNRRLARACFQRALQLAEGADDPDGFEVAKRAKEKILFFDEIDRMASDAVPPLPFTEEEDDPIDPSDPPEDDGGGSGRRPSSRGSSGGLFESFMRMCRQAGVDPEEVLDEIGGRMPFRFRPEDSAKPEGKNGR
jgi:hypothetical protein